MTAENERLLMYVGGGALLLFVLFPEAFSKLLAKTAVSTGIAAGNIVVKTAEGTVIGIGEAVGIPQTDAQLCEQYVNAGNWGQASFYCPAGTFLKSASGAVWDATIGQIVGYAAPSAQSEVISLSSPEESGMAEQYVPPDVTEYMTPDQISP